MLILSVNLAERDAFDTLFDHAPDKLNVVKKVRLPLPHISSNGKILPWQILTAYALIGGGKCSTAVVPQHCIPIGQG